MEIQWEGRTWQYQDRAVTVSMCRIIKSETGLRWPSEFGEAIGKMDPDAVAALMWLVKTQNGVQATIGDQDGSPLDFLEAYGKAAQAEADKAEPVDPPPVVGESPPPTTSPTFVTATSSVLG